MKTHGKFITPILLLALAMLVMVIGWLIGQSMMPFTQNVSAQGKPRGLFATPENLRYVGLAFTPVEATENRAQAALTREKAIEAALSNEPGLKAATDVDARLGLLGPANDSLVISSDLAEGNLVWVVTFFGVETASSGPPGAPRYISNEYHVVINAFTGKYVMALPLYNVTPKPPFKQDVPPSKQPKKSNPSSDSVSTPLVAPTETLAP